jgi:2-isopropylmalate synthase
VGDNAFAHEAGIHQDGVLKEKRTYEIMTPESVGRRSSKLVLGKHSGRHAFRDRLQQLGFELSGDEFDRVFKRFKRLADQKKDVYDEDIEEIIAEEVLRIPDSYHLKFLNVTSGTELIPTASVQLEVHGSVIKDYGAGDGPVDAAFKTIAKIVNTKSRLVKYSVNAITGGTDAQGVVNVRLEEDGIEVVGRGADTDIIVASAKAYVNALNKLERRKKANQELKRSAP